MTESTLGGEEARAELYEAISRTDDFEEACRDALDVAVAYLGVETGTVARFDAEDRTFDRLASTDETETTLPTAYCQRTIERDRPVTVSDSETDESGVRFYHGTRLRVDGDVFGILCFSATSGISFGEAEATFVELVARSLERELERIDDEERPLEQSAAARLDALFERSPDMVDILDTDGTILDANRRFCEELGYTKGEILGTNIWEIDSMVDGDSVHELLAGLSVGERRRFEGRYERRDGSEFPVEVHLIRLDVTASDRVLVISRDMTERKRTEERLREEKVFNEVALQSVIDFYWVLDTDGHVREWSDADGSVTGYTAEEAIGRHATTFFPPEEQEYIVEKIAVLKETGSVTARADFETKSGERVPYQFDGINLTDETGTVRRMCGLGRDVSEQVRRERALKERERTLRDVYDVMANRELTLEAQIDELLEIGRSALGTDYGSFSHVEQGDYTFEAVAAPEGTDLEAGTTIPLAETNCERAVSTRETLVLNDIKQEAPELTDRAGNAQFGISCYVGAPVVVDGEVYGTFCFYDSDCDAGQFSEWEVTFADLLGNWLGSRLEEKRREAELEASNERLEQFASSASHDLQEPLRMVSSYLQLIDKRYGDELDEDGREFLEFAVNGAERMKEMIDALLAYSRVESRGKPLEPVDLDAVLEDSRKNLQMRIEESDADITAESLPRVNGDENQLRQVFQNLLDNAIEYSGEDAPRVDVSAERDGSEWVISVRDTGIGIEPERVDDVFDVFGRLHSHEEHAGTGIGLALCQRIVERHGGELWVDSEPGEGSTFSFTLPAVETDSSDRSSNPARKE